jgi:hypothetical protein
LRLAGVEIACLNQLSFFPGSRFVAIEEIIS